MGPLQGCRILDLTSVVMGPYATQQLGDLGAEVILVEPCEGGNNRRMGASRHEELSGTALNLLRNKRSFAVDLKTEAGREAVLRLAATSDAFVSNLRPKPLSRLGLAYGDVAAVRPDIVYCQAQGYPSDSTRADEPAYDDVIQAECGLADAARRSGRDPQLAPTIMADKICGLTISQAVIAALFHRLRTGAGQRIEIPMLDVMQAFLLVEHGGEAIVDPDGGAAGYSRVLNPERGPQRTRDGWICVLPYSKADFSTLFRAAGLDHLADDPRIADQVTISRHAESLYRDLRPVIAQRTTAHWLAFCKTHGIPVGSIKSLEEIAATMPIRHHPVAGPYRSVSSPMRFSASPSEVAREAPLIGEDTRMLLEEAGYSSAAIASMERNGVITAR